MTLGMWKSLPRRNVERVALTGQNLTKIRKLFEFCFKRHCSSLLVARTGNTLKSPNRGIADNDSFLRWILE